MRRSKFKVRRPSHEFELDLAPLLSVMVKLVPVLLISSAFVQVMTIESDLPGSLQRAIAESQKEQITVRILADSKNDLTFVVSTPTGEKTTKVPAVSGTINFDGTYEALLDIKKSYPQIFQLSIRPNGQTKYQDMVRVMDEARKARAAEIEFPYTDPDTKETRKTSWMFPEIMIEPVEAT